ncbi:hypothetical protein HAT91_03155 [Dickeya solani]|nr:hypothetical protein HAT91_03155 [Dickeya solani]
MVSLHSVMRYFSHPKPTPELSDDDKQQIQRLLRWFGGGIISNRSMPVLPGCV